MLEAQRSTLTTKTVTGVRPPLARFAKNKNQSVLYSDSDFGRDAAYHLWASFYFNGDDFLLSTLRNT